MHSHLSTPGNYSVLCVMTTSIVAGMGTLSASDIVPLSNSGQTRTVSVPCIQIYLQIPSYFVTRPSNHHIGSTEIHFVLFNSPLAIQLVQYDTGDGGLSHMSDHHPRKYCTGLHSQSEQRVRKVLYHRITLHLESIKSRGPWNRCSSRSSA